MSKERMLRIQAHDPGVLARTADALAAAQQIARPPLRLRCSRCRQLLAQVGDVPSYGPLFASSWEVEPDGHGVVRNGRELRGREKRRWLAENYEILEESGEPVDAPLRHGVTALLFLKDGLAQDYPDLLIRCDEGHGDSVADRFETVALLRQAVASGKRMDIYVNLGERVEYLTPANPIPEGQSKTRRIVRRFKTRDTP